jgi:hypothetical protein
MIIASELIREKNIFILHGVSTRGANYIEGTSDPNNELTYSLIDKYYYISNPVNVVSSYTYNNNPNMDEKRHRFSEQGFIIRESNIIHADRDDSGTPRDILNMNRKEPNLICDMDNVIDSSREGWNELLIANTSIFGFYFSQVNPNGDIYYSLQDIYDLHITTGIIIYQLNNNGFYQCMFNTSLHRSNNASIAVNIINL